MNLPWDAFRFVIRGMISYWNVWTIAFLHFSQYIVNNEAKTLMEEHYSNTKLVLCLVMSDSATPWTVACQAPLSMGFFRQEYWSGLPYPLPRDPPNSWIVHCRWILYHLSQQGSPRILEWVAYPFSRGSSWPRNRTGVSCIAGEFFTSWATREAQN